MTPPRRTNHSAGGRTRRSGAGHSAPDEAILNFSAPTPITLSISIFVVKGTSPGALTDYLDAATRRLQRYGFSLDVYPSNRVPIEIDYVGKITPKFGADNEDTEAAKARAKAALAFDDHANPLRFPVIMAPIEQADQGGTQHGVTQVDFSNTGRDGSKTVDNVTWLPYTILDSGQKDQDSGALLHEMGHGALLWHPGEGPDQSNVASTDLANVMRASSPTAPARVNLNKKQVRALANCYFAKPRTAIP